MSETMKAIETPSINEMQKKFAGLSYSGKATIVMGAVHDFSSLLTEQGKDLLAVAVTHCINENFDLAMEVIGEIITEHTQIKLPTGEILS